MRKLIGIFVVLLACTTSTKEESNPQIIEIHNTAIKKGNEVEKIIDKIKNYAKDSTDSLENRLLDSVEVLRDDLTEWKETIVEVPGYEHNHVHDHSHKEPLQLTPDMMLEIQKDIEERVDKLLIRAQEISEKLD